MARLNILLLYGGSGSGKTFMTERVLAIEYDVATCKMDELYYEAIEHAGIPKLGKTYRIRQQAYKLRHGEYDRRTSDAFFAKLSELIHQRLRKAYTWRVGMVFEGATLKFPDEVRLIREAADATAGANSVISRVHLMPPLDDWNRNRAVKMSRRRGKDVLKPRGIRDRVALKLRRQQATEALKPVDDGDLEPPEPVEGVDDYTVANVDEMRELADKRLKLRRYKWHQGFTLGPVSVTGVSDSSKLDVVLTDDVAGKSILDVCCNTGVHAIMAKQRGAVKAVGVELNARAYCKALELKKVLRRHSDVDTMVAFRLGDAVELIPTIGRFDTVLFFGALHYFPDYHEILGSVAHATRDVAYVEFNFSEGPNDTAAVPGAIRPWVRKSGKTVYMGDRDTIVETVKEAMPGFEIEDRTSTSRRATDREIWRMRRTE